MSALIQLLDKSQVRHLISTSRDVSLKDGEMEIFDRCMLSSTSIWAGLTPKRQLACVWGLIPPSLLSDRAYLWLYTTDLVKDHEFIFVRNSQLAIEEMLKLYPVLVGHVKIGNDEALRWLRWLGAKFSDPADGAIPFTIRREV